MVERPPPDNLERPKPETLSLLAAALTFAAISITSAAAQTAKPKMATDIPPEITTPDTVETRLGRIEVLRWPSRQ